MPWDCRKCNEHIADDSVAVCTNCKTEKADWTLAADRTRNFVVPSRKSELLVGGGSKPVDTLGSYGGGRAVERAPTSPTALALSWHKTQKLPPPERVLVVRMWVADKDKDLKLGLTIEWATRKAETLPDLEWKAIKPTTSSADTKKKYFDARLLLVHAHQGQPWPVDKKFAGIEVIDVTDVDGPDGHAPGIGVKPFGLGKRIALPLDAFRKGWAQRLQCYELEFNHDSHMMKPEGLDVIWEVMRKGGSASYANMRLLVTGHTDSSGDEQTVNMPLSQRRCENIIHLIALDRNAWAASSCDSYTRLLGRDARKAALDRDLIKLAFPAAAKKVGDWSSVAGWRVVYDAYEAELVRRGDVFEFTGAQIQAINALATEAARKEAREELEKEFDKQKKEALADNRDKIQWVDPERKFVPCGERYLKVKTGANEKKERNRRDEFLWFSKERAPWDPNDAATRPRSHEEAQALVYGDATQAEWDYNTFDGPYTFDQLDCPADPPIEVPPNDAVFVIDCSGSMGGALRTGSATSRIVACRRALQQVIRRIPAGNRFAIHRFNHDVGVWDTGQLVRATQSTLNEACLWVATLPVVGGTDTWSALESALAVREVKRIVLLSDGEPTDRVTNEPAVLEYVRTSAVKVPIDTYGFLAVPDPTDEAERAIVQTDRDTVGAELTLQMVGVPEGQAITQEVLAARHLALANALNAKRIKTARGNAWNQTYVRNLLLGWFLARLSKDTNGNPFVDLTSRV